jgi:hypothetical protein
MAGELANGLFLRMGKLGAVSAGCGGERANVSLIFRGWRPEAVATNYSRTSSKISQILLLCI